MSSASRACSARPPASPCSWGSWHIASSTYPSAAPAGSLRRTTYSIAAGAFLASMAMNFWVPLLPLYMQQLGAGNPASALFWSAVASVALGAGRIVSGPLWGALSDRFGRKLMFVRALCFASTTILIVAAAQAPWHVTVAFGVQGLFSGFIPAAVALMSVSVPEHRMGSSLSLVTGGQYLGTTIGPAFGAGLVVFLGFRGSILAGAALPLLAALLVVLLVPRDSVQRRAPAPETEGPVVRERALWRTLSTQFYVAILIFFLLFAMGDVLRLLTPLRLQATAGIENAAKVSGIAFSLSGAAAVLGVVFIGQRWVRIGRLRVTLLAGTLVSAGSAIVLAFAFHTVAVVALFALISLLNAALIPAVNTLIATHVDRDRRGTGFGIASSAQALAFVAGPAVAATFGGISLALGFVAAAVVFALAAAVAFFAVREPAPQLAPFDRP